MKYRLTVQHNKNDNEQSVTIINDREDAKTEYLKSCEKDYFTQLERCRCSRSGCARLWSLSKSTGSSKIE